MTIAAEYVIAELAMCYRQHTVPSQDEYMAYFAICGEFCYIE